MIHYCDGTDRDGRRCQNFVHDSETLRLSQWVIRRYFNFDGAEIYRETLCRICVRRELGRS